MFIRLAILIMALLSFAGPWAFDRIMVPEPNNCSSPFVRLDGEFCGLPFVGFQVPILAAIGFYQTIASYLDGTLQLAEAIRFSSISIPLILLPSPIFIGLAFSLRGHGTKLVVPASTVWALAALVAFLYGAVGYSAFHFANWGTWLFLGLSVAALAFELPILIKTAKA